MFFTRGRSEIVLTPEGQVKVAELLEHPPKKSQHRHSRRPFEASGDRQTEPIPDDSGAGCQHRT